MLSRLIITLLALDSFSSMKNSYDLILMSNPDFFRIESYQRQQKLLKTLFDDYNPYIIPIEKKNQSLKVQVGAHMIQIVNMYEKEGLMKTSLWLYMQWNDNQLKWDHLHDLKKIKNIRVPHTKIWTPDILFINNADSNYDPQFKPNIVIQQNGRLLWGLPFVFNTTCELQVTNFPFDDQNCELRIGSWAYDTKFIELDYLEGREHIILDEYTPSGQWDLLDVPAKIVNDISNDGNIRNQIIFTIKLRRKTLFILITTIIPIFLLSSISMCVFYMPSKAKGKINLSSSILFSLLVYFKILVTQLQPSNAVIPLITKYLLLTFMLNLFALFNALITINLYFKSSHGSTKKVGKWTRKIFIEFLPKILFINTSIKLENYQESINLREKMVSNRINKSESVFKDYEASKLYDVARLRSLPIKIIPRSKSLNTINVKTTRNCMRNVAKSIENIKFILDFKMKLNESVREWSYISLVLDRLMMLIYIIATFVTITSMIMSAPYILSNIDQKEVIAARTRFF